MALSEYNIKVELREILLKDRPNELLNISPKGTVPVLQLPNKNVLDESLDIINWVLNNNDSNWRETNYEEQKTMIKNNDEEFKHYLDRYKYNDRYPEKSKEFYQKKCEVYLKNYEEKLTENMFLVSDKMQIADIALFPFLRQYAHINKIQFSKYSGFNPVPEFCHECNNKLENTYYNKKNGYLYCNNCKRVDGFKNSKNIYNFLIQLSTTHITKLSLYNINNDLSFISLLSNFL